MDTLLVLMILLGIGIADLVLYFTGNKTISQYYHKLLPQWADLAIMITLLVLSVVYIGWETFALLMCGVIMGHLFWHEGG